MTALLSCRRLERSGESRVRTIGDLTRRRQEKRDGRRGCIEEFVVVSPHVAPRLSFFMHSGWGNWLFYCNSLISHSTNGICPVGALCNAAHTSTVEDVVHFSATLQSIGVHEICWRFSTVLSTQEPALATRDIVMEWQTRKTLMKPPSLLGYMKSYNCNILAAKDLTRPGWLTYTVHGGG